jgi:hypothetical protein
MAGLVAVKAVRVLLAVNALLFDFDNRLGLDISSIRNRELTDACCRDSDEHCWY